MAGRRLLCVGALTHDSIYRLATLPTTSGKFIPEDAVQTAAGMASSAATAAARQGGAVTLWASVGDDALGRDLIAELSAEGIDCSFIRRVPGGRSAIAAILVDREGERIIVPHYDPKTQAEPDSLPFPDMAGFDAVLTDVRWPGAAALALVAAKAAGIPAILDVDVAPRAVLERLMPLATHIVASKPAAAIWCGDEGPAEAAVLRIAAEFDALVAVTDGGAGTAWLDRTDGTVRHVPAPKVEAVDTLAAGDVFHGCFALAIAEGQAVEAAIAYASAAAALKCLRFGGRLGAPTRAETEAFLAARPGGG